MLNQQEQQFEDDRPYPGTETFGISAETDTEIWDLLQRPEDRQTRTYLPDEMPAREVQRIFGNLPENPFTLEADAELTDDQPTQPLEPEFYAEDLSVIDRLCGETRLLRFDVDELRRNAEGERIERQGQLDSLEDRFDDLLSATHRDMSELQRQIDQCSLETGIQSRLDRQDWERRLESLTNRIDGVNELRSSRCSAAARFLRVAAVMVLGFSVATFATAGFSGSSSQKDNFAQAGGLAAILGIGAAAIGYALD